MVMAQRRLLIIPVSVVVFPDVSVNTVVAVGDGLGKVVMVFVMVLPPAFVVVETPVTVRKRGNSKALWNRQRTSHSCESYGPS